MIIPTPVYMAAVSTYKILLFLITITGLLFSTGAGFCETIQMIAVDIDGTLTHQNSVSKNNIRALNRAKSNGVVITVCTGRSQRQISHVTARIEFNAPLILLEGALIWDSDHGKAITQYFMRGREISNFLNPFLDRGFKFLLVGENGETITIDGRADARQSDKSESTAEGFFSEIIADQAQVFKISILDRDSPWRSSARLNALANELGQYHGSQYTYHFNRKDDSIVAVHVTPAGVDKGAALKELCRYLGVDVENVLAIGDGDNDVSLLETAGYSVAMRNATRAAKNAASFVTDSAENDGVASAIQRFVLRTP